ncbi:MAG: hypothetical protein J6S63_02410 [Atopobiaceae bacterium]|nr:hypothetical protein [Atopobiaceae bacterium]
MDTTTLHRRLRALLVGVLVAACVVAATFVVLPAQGVRADDVDYGYVYSGAKSSSVAFVKANLQQDSLLVLGSSEFSTPARLVPQVPAAAMGTHNYGVRLMLVGEAFDQCLWDTIAMGALAAGGVPHNKVALIVGLGMFTDGGLDASTFPRASRIRCTGPFAPTGRYLRRCVPRCANACSSRAWTRRPCVRATRRTRSQASMPWCWMPWTTSSSGTSWARCARRASSWLRGRWRLPTGRRCASRRSRTRSA